MYPNNNSFAKSNPQINENIEEVFSEYVGCKSHLNIDSNTKKPHLTAQWYRENGKMVCRWVAI